MKGDNLTTHYKVEVMQAIRGAGYMVITACAILLSITYSQITSLEMIRGVTFSSFVTIAVVALGMFLAVMDLRPLPAPLLPWLILALTMLVSLALRPSIPGAQNFLAFLGFVLVIHLCGGKPRVRHRIVELIGLATLIAGTFVSALFVFLTFATDFFIPDARAFGLTYLVLASASFLFSDKLWLHYSAWLIFAGIVVSESRMAIVAAGLVMVVGHLFKPPDRPAGGPKFMMLSAVLALSIFVALQALRPSIRDVFLNHGDQRIHLPNFLPWRNEPLILNSNGRIDAWRQLLAQMDSPGNWIFGRGTGFSASFLRETSDYFEQALNEYIRLLVDNGLFGLGLFLIGMAWLWIHIFRSSNNSYRIPALLVLLTLPLVITSESALTYVFYYLPAATLIGVGLTGTAGGDQVRFDNKTNFSRQS